METSISSSRFGTLNAAPSLPFTFCSSRGSLLRRRGIGIRIHFNFHHKFYPSPVSCSSSLCLPGREEKGNNNNNNNNNSNNEVSLSGQAVRQLPRDRFLQVVLVSPQIPGNTGCIARTCAASVLGLHLVGVDDSKLKRAGLDYWPYVVVKVHNSWADFREYFSKQEGSKRLLAFTKRGTQVHSEFLYRKGDWLVFGSETSGLPPEALLDCKGETYGGGTLRIPMVETYVRCLNLSVSVGIAVYEACRQLNYEQLQLPSEKCVDSEQSPFFTEDIFA